MMIISSQIVSIPVLVENQDKNPCHSKQTATHFTHVKGPWDKWDIVQKKVWKWRIFLHIRDTVMHNNHNHGCDTSNRYKICNAQ